MYKPNEFELKVIATNLSVKDIKYGIIAEDRKSKTFCFGCDYNGFEIFIRLYARKEDTKIREVLVNKIENQKRYINETKNKKYNKDQLFKILLAIEYKEIIKNKAEELYDIQLITQETDLEYMLEDYVKKYLKNRQECTHKEVYKHCLENFVKDKLIEINQCNS